MVVKSLEEEVNGRNYAIEQGKECLWTVCGFADSLCIGIRDLSASIVLPENDFSIISKKVSVFELC